MGNDPVGVDKDHAVFEALDNRLGFALLVNQPIDIELFELLESLPPFLLNSDATT